MDSKSEVNLFESNTRIDEKAVSVNDFAQAVSNNHELLESLDSSVEIKSINSADDSATNRYNLYDNMSKDSIISAALEMYADDALTVTPDNEYFSISQKIADNETSQAVNEAKAFLDAVNIGKHLWTIYYQLAKYGECFVELFYSRKPIAKIDNYTSVSRQVLDNLKAVPETGEQLVMEDYVEVVSRPDLIKDVVVRGATMYYILDDKSNSLVRNNPEEYYRPSYKYIHFILGNEDSSRWSELEVTISPKSIGLSNNTDNKLAKKVRGKILRGRSILYDVEKSYRNLSLVENIAMMSKLTRASITRVANVEVGGMSKGDTRKAVHRVKSKIKNKISINEDTGSSNYIDVTGMDNIIVNPTMQGKGSLDITTIDQSDPDVKSVLDLDYFSNKLFGGLKIPKAYLGFEADLNDSGGETLSQLSIRYSRTVNKIQSAVEEGLNNLCFLYLTSEGHDEYTANNIKVTIQPPVTKEEQEKLENMSSKLESIDKIVQALPDDEKLRSEASIILLKDLGNSSLTKLLIDYEHAKQEILDEQVEGVAFEEDKPDKAAPPTKSEPKESEEQPELDELFSERDAQRDSNNDELKQP